MQGTLPRGSAAAAAATRVDVAVFYVPAAVVPLKENSLPGEDTDAAILADIILRVNAAALTDAADTHLPWRNGLCRKGQQVLSLASLPAAVEPPRPFSVHTYPSSCLFSLQYTSGSRCCCPPCRTESTTVAAIASFLETVAIAEWDQHTRSHI